MSRVITSHPFQSLDSFEYIQLKAKDVDQPNGTSLILLSTSQSKLPAAISTKNKET
jgi:hypothetical protein